MALCGIGRDAIWRENASRNAVASPDNNDAAASQTPPHSSNRFVSGCPKNRWVMPHPFDYSPPEDASATIEYASVQIAFPKVRPLRTGPRKVLVCSSSPKSSRGLLWDESTIPSSSGDAFE